MGRLVEWRSYPKPRLQRGRPLAGAAPQVCCCHRCAAAPRPDRLVEWRSYPYVDRFLLSIGEYSWLARMDFLV
uniref:Uncharacterized protein n=1 Tax=Arundo donax TaxID=35708 RepID=A0A0A8YBT1_ARUDO